MTSQEIIKYYKPNIIKLLISAVFSKREAEIDDLWDKGWFTPQEYEAYKNKDIKYQQMIQIYANRKIDFAKEYIKESYDTGYLDKDTYDFYIEFYIEYNIGTITYEQMEQAMYIVLQTIKNNRLADYNDKE